MKSVGEIKAQSERRPKKHAQNGRHEPDLQKLQGAWRCRGCSARAKHTAGGAPACFSREPSSDDYAAQTAARKHDQEGCTHGNEGNIETGDVGTDRPCAVVIVSLRRRLIERWDSARSSDRKERPASTSCRLGLKVRKMASSADFAGTPESMLNVPEVMVIGRLSCVCFFTLRRWGDGARDEDGESSEWRPEVKRGEY